MRDHVRRLVESRAFQIGILILIAINAVVIGLQTCNLPSEINMALNIFDVFCVGIYVIEAVLKIYAWRGEYFKNGWNIFDFILVVICLIPAGALPIPAQALRLLRTMRMLRVFRLVSALRPLRIIIEAIGRSIPGIGWTALLLLIIYYVYAVTGVSAFSENFPERFGDIGKSFFSLFQVMTLEGWATEIARPVIEAQPLAVSYFVSFIIISSFIVLNVIVGIVVSTIGEASKHLSANTRSSRDEGAASTQEELAEAIEELDAQMERVKELAARVQAESRRDS